MYNILVDKSDNTIIDYNKDFLILEDATVVMQNGYLKYVFSSLGSNRAVCHEIVDAIESFDTRKYLFVDDNVVPNPEWSD